MRLKLTFDVEIVAFLLATWKNCCWCMNKYKITDFLFKVIITNENTDF